MTKSLATRGNLKGPTGSTGTQGSTGPTGAKGDTGATGPQGATGPAGSTTIRGTTDYDNATAPAEGQAPVWSAASSKFTPRLVELVASKSTAAAKVANGYIGADAIGNVSPANQYAASATSYGVTRLRQEAGSAAPGDHTHGVDGLTATGTRDASTFLRGDNTWSAGPTGPQGATGPAGPAGAPWTFRMTNVSGAVAVGEAVYFDASSAVLDATIPATPTVGSRVYIGKPDTSLNAVRILATINGDTDGVRLVSPGAGVTLVYTSLGWRIESATPSGFAAGNAPSVEMRLTTAYTGLASADYFMSGNMSMIGTDPWGMFSTAFPFYRVIIPITGRYDVEWSWVSSQSTGNTASKVLLNAPSSGFNAVSSAVQQYSILTAIQVAVSTGEGTPCHIRRTRMFNAGDALAFCVFSTTTFNMPVTTFGGIDTRFRVSYEGRV